jgi:hypothetical protein
MRRDEPSADQAPFAERWAAKARSLPEHAGLVPMVACGGVSLPHYAPPSLAFDDAPMHRSVWDLYELSSRRFGEAKERLSRLVVIGSDGAGNPLCMHANRGEVIMLDHENLFEEGTFVNTSVEHLAECLLAYLGEHDPARFRAAVEAIDAPAMADQAFWWFEAADLGEGPGDAAAAAGHSTPLPAGGMRRMLARAGAAMRRLLGREG